MILDEHTACPACPQVVRDLYAIARRAQLRMPYTGHGEVPEYDELLAVLEAFRPWIEAHHANQFHSHSLELEDARAPQLTAIAVDHEGSQR